MRSWPLGLTQWRSGNSSPVRAQQIMCGFQVVVSVPAAAEKSQMPTAVAPAAFNGVPASPEQSTVCPSLVTTGAYEQPSSGKGPLNVVGGFAAGKASVIVRPAAVSAPP